MKKRRILRSERGFTLVELGIVMAIIAILAAVAYPTYTGMQTRAFMSEAKALLQEVRVDLWASFVEHGSFPAWTTVTPPTVTGWTWSTATADTGNGYTYAFKITGGATKKGAEVTMHLNDTGGAKFEP